MQKSATSLLDEIFLGGDVVSIYNYCWKGLIMFE